MAGKSTKNSKSWFTRILLFLNWVLILALVVSYLSPITRPETTVIPALLALVYPVLLIANFIFVLFWIFRFKYYFIFSLLALLAGYNSFFKTITFNKEKPVGSYSDAIKMVSYNVRLFDQYKWAGDQNYFTRNSVFDFIHAQQADIVCFQEFFHGNEKSFPTIEPFLEKSNALNYHIDFVKTVGDKKHYGLATFTKYPIVGKGIIRFENARSNSGTYTDVIFKKDTIRVFNVHLESVRFSKADHKFVAEIIDPGQAIHSSNSRVIVQKLSQAFKKREKQADVVAQYLAESPYPVIVCGDFNDTPLSYVYRTIAKNLNDSFLEIGNGVGSTYAGGIPFLRIDFILHSDVLEPFRFKKHDVNYSDHYPLSCYFKIK